jgi:lysozyme
MVASCIDISHYQGFPDFAKAKASGVVAVIHKATQGVSYSDPNRKKNCINAVNAGLAVCTYHWITPNDNVLKQIDFYLKEVDPVPGERVVIDYEQQGCTLTGLKLAVGALLKDPRNLQITVYSGHLLKEQLGTTRDAYLAENTDLWIAQYTSAASPSWPKGTYPNYTLWQYSESGRVPGITDNQVDLNRFNGSDENLVKWIGPVTTGIVTPPKPPEVAIDEQPVPTINIVTTGLVKVLLNGTPMM